MRSKFHCFVYGSKAIKIIQLSATNVCLFAKSIHFVWYAAAFVFYRVVAKVQFLRTLWEETSYQEVTVTQIVCFLVPVQFEVLLSLCYYIGLVIYSRRSWLIKHSSVQTVKLLAN